MKKLSLLLISLPLMLTSCSGVGTDYNAWHDNASRRDLENQKYKVVGQRLEAEGHYVYDGDSYKFKFHEIYILDGDNLVRDTPKCTYEVANDLVKFAIGLFLAGPYYTKAVNISNEETTKYFSFPFHIERSEPNEKLYFDQYGNLTSYDYDYNGSKVRMDLYYNYASIN